jgi:hypothetical protein
MEVSNVDRRLLDLDVATKHLLLDLPERDLTPSQFERHKAVSTMQLLYGALLEVKRQGRSELVLANG